jgi:hypothetical protein
VSTLVPSFDVATLAYVAGLFDGEGSIVIGYNKPDATRGRKVPSYWLQVGITSTDRSLIDWLHATFAGHSSDNSLSPSRKNRRSCWAWRTMGTQARAFLQDISWQSRFVRSWQSSRARATGVYVAHLFGLRVSSADAAIGAGLRVPPLWSGHPPRPQREPEHLSRRVASLWTNRRRRCAPLRFHGPCWGIQRY